MIYLAKQEIVYINKSQLSFGGFISEAKDNLLNEGTLEWLIEVVQVDIFGVRRFITIFEVASAYSFYIICEHVFYDGSKRTGIQSALLFLEKNGYKQKKNSKLNIDDFALDIENKKYDLNQIVRIFQENFNKEK